MCGIFGIIGSEITDSEVKILANHASQRGKDSSGLILGLNNDIEIYRSDDRIKVLLKEKDFSRFNLVFGHSRLITNGLNDNQPIYRDGIALLHNGIIVNDDNIWKKLNIDRKFIVDSEVLIGITLEHLKKNAPIESLPERIFSEVHGIVSASIYLMKLGKLILISNNGSLYLGSKNKKLYFSSEKFPLEKIECINVQQIKKNYKIVDCNKILSNPKIVNHSSHRINLIPNLENNSSEEKLLLFEKLNLKRCAICILPETMPFIEFDNLGVCNYCKNYKLRNQPKDISELYKILESYKKLKGDNCIVPFSGGRDSSFGLHYIVKELKMKPITFTYDWGMVTDLARRNISRMSAILGVENIIIADDIEKKRKFIAKNLIAWLKSPNIGMLSLLTAGDKHFFRYIDKVKVQTKIDLNLWSINPLEVTHFKSGFLGIPPDFKETKVYSTKWAKQLNYQYKRFYEMLKSPQYFNSSLWDTLSGEYYRTFRKKTHYFHLFDFLKWDEAEIDSTLENYSWEKALDTNTTWRIGDGTAAFYNYVYYTVAGFTEHDTFRSNQIREGQITREHGLRLVQEENKPRYQNIKWYLDVLNMDFKSVISVINSIQKKYD